jgi:hypothetical protein
MKAPSPRHAAKILVLTLLATCLCASTMNAPKAFAVTRTEVQMGDPDIGDLAPKKASILRRREYSYPVASKFGLLIEIAKILYFRVHWL